MATNRETLASLEAKIGFPPKAASKPELLKHVDQARWENLCFWLAKQGIPYGSVKSASNTSLVTAYCESNYLREWRNRVNPSFALLGNDDEEAAPKANSDAGLNKPVATVDEAWLRKLYEQMELTTAKLIDTKLASLKINLDDGAKAQIRDLARSASEAAIAAAMPPRQIEIIACDGATATNIGLQHETFDTLLRAAQVRNHKGYRLNVWLTGPTGSGKTSAAEAVSVALEPTFTSYSKDTNGTWIIRDATGAEADLNGLSHDAPFGADSSLDADYKVVGFKDANGKFHWTTFLRILVYGGIYVADEIDNWNPSALLALNSALANGWISTPLGMLRRHKDACIVACANTWGLGATSGYVGRTRLDDATLDRFQPKILWPYDEKLEQAIASDSGGELGLRWHQWVTQARHAAQRQGLKIIISPRGTFDGIVLLKSGFTWTEVTDMTIAAGLSPEQKKAVGLDQVPAEGGINRGEANGNATWPVSASA